MKKPSEQVQKETEILANRIMPKTDFKKVIEHDKVYYNAMNQALEFHTIKEDILRKKCENILGVQKRDLIIKEIDMLCDWSETQVKILDYKARLRIQKNLVDDKSMHYDNIFLPQFNQEVKEAKENFADTLKKARAFVSSKREGVENIKEKLNYELTWWDKCSKEKQANEEFILQVYKPLKRILNAYDNKDKNKK